MSDSQLLESGQSIVDGKVAARPQERLSDHNEEENRIVSQVLQRNK